MKKIFEFIDREAIGLIEPIIIFREFGNYNLIVND